MLFSWEFIGIFYDVINAKADLSILSGIDWRQREEKGEKQKMKEMTGKRCVEWKGKREGGNKRKEKEKKVKKIREK